MTTTSPPDAYVELFAEPGFKAPIRTIHLSEGSRVASLSSFGAPVRSVRAFGPSNIAVRLWRYANARGEAMEWSIPASGTLEVDDDELTSVGLGGKVAVVDWFVDDALPWHHDASITIAKVYD